jgi:hypothetical protein
VTHHFVWFENFPDQHQHPDHIPQRTALHREVDYAVVQGTAVMKTQKVGVVRHNHSTLVAGMGEMLLIGCADQVGVHGGRYRHPAQAQTRGDPRVADLIEVKPDRPSYARNPAV